MRKFRQMLQQSDIDGSKGFSIFNQDLPQKSQYVYNEMVGNYGKCRKY